MDNTIKFSGKARVSPLDRSIDKSKSRYDVSFLFLFLDFFLLKFF